MKIAFASKDNIHVNQHFGWCEKFFIYEIIKKEFVFLGELDASLKISDEIEKLSYKIECLKDSDIVYVQQIGPKASTLVKANRIFPLQSSYEGEEKIQAVLEKLISLKDNPPLWMRRFI